MALFGSDTKSEAKEAGQKAERDIANLGQRAKEQAEAAKDSAAAYGRQAEENIKDAAHKIADNPVPVPNYSDIAKAANDLLNKDFYHAAAAELEVKSKTPNGVVYEIKGKSAHDKTPTGSMEGKYTDKSSGITGTVTWSTLNNLDAKLELQDNIAKGLTIESLTTFKPDTQTTGQKLNVFFKQPAFQLRAHTDLLKGPTATLDGVIGHNGFVVGGETAYDVEKAAITRYSATVGYQTSAHNFSVIATDNLSIFSAAYYQHVNEQVQVGSKATWDSKSSSTVGLEVAGKYINDPLSFTKAKINDRGILALAYNTRVRDGVTFGVGASFDTQKINESTHQIGLKFAFES